jgi:hypothetical protein
LTAQIQKPKGRGGPGRGQGRKPDPLKDVRTGAVTAQKLLKELKAEEEIKRLYKLLAPDRQMAVIFKLRDSAYGRPATSEEQQKPPVTPTINVNIRRIGT